MTIEAKNFFSGDGPGGNIVTDPRLLPFTIITSTGVAETLYVKAAQNSILSLDSTSAWTAMPNGVGYKYTTALVADTYYTVVDLTGGPGVLYSIICNRPYAAGTSTVRITRDGVVYTISKTIPTYGRLIIGPVMQGVAPTSSTAFLTTHVGIMSAYPTDGFGKGSFQIRGQSYLPHPVEHASFGLPMMSFDDNLKIEIKSAVVDNNAPRGYAVAFCRQF